MIFLFSFFYGDFSRAAAAKKQKKNNQKRMDIVAQSD